MDQHDRLALPFGQGRHRIGHRARLACAASAIGQRRVSACSGGSATTTPRRRASDRDTVQRDEMQPGVEPLPGRHRPPVASPHEHFLCHVLGLVPIVQQAARQGQQARQLGPDELAHRAILALGHARQQCGVGMPRSSQGLAGRCPEDGGHGGISLRTGFAAVTLHAVVAHAFLATGTTAHAATPHASPGRMRSSGVNTPSPLRSMRLKRSVRAAVISALSR
jgi:hypothetical protein